MKPVKRWKTTAGILGGAWALFSAGGCAAVENVSMAATLSVEGNHVVVRWASKGFHHYNIRWSGNNGAQKQVQREGDKDFRYLSVFRHGVVYRVAVQGCDKGMLSRSDCTSWEDVSCGTAGAPCRGVR